MYMYQLCMQLKIKASNWHFNLVSFYLKVYMYIHVYTHSYSWVALGTKIYIIIIQLFNLLNLIISIYIFHFQESQIDALFHKIDWSSEGRISWDEFCTYMQLEYAEKEDSYLRAKQVAFLLPARTSNMPHRDSILRIHDTSDGAFMGCSQDGLMTIWSSNNELKKSKSLLVGTTGYHGCHCHLVNIPISLSPSVWQCQWNTSVLVYMWSR